MGVGYSGERFESERGPNVEGSRRRRSGTGNHSDCRHRRLAAGRTRTLTVKRRPLRLGLDPVSDLRSVLDERLEAGLAVEPEVLVPLDLAILHQKNAGRAAKGKVAELIAAADELALLDRVTDRADHCEVREDRGSARATLDERGRQNDSLIAPTQTTKTRPNMGESIGTTVRTFSP